ncbi:hypothetical protein [Clavibacter michiganensis]|uniref:hypothetical protein n=1 Tax=Clavibacter michiganensis TaxID=28447 RepID=UPI003EB81DE9
MTRDVKLFALELETHDAEPMLQLLTARGDSPLELTERQLLERQIILQAERIRTVVAPNTPRGVLPVVVGPEFFFTGLGNRPYNYGTFSASLPHLEQVSRSYPDVLWCPGTVWWKEKLVDKRGPESRVHNTALVFQGGRLIGSHQKTRVSDLDPQHPTHPLQWDEDETIFARIAQETQFPFFDAEMPGGGEAVRIGLEVGMDHVRSWDSAEGRPSPFGDLRSRYLEASTRRAGGRGVDLHLLTTAGTPIHEADVVARDGGAVFSSDGGVDANPRSRSGYVTRSGVDRATSLREWRPSIRYSTPRFHTEPGRVRVAEHPSIALG